MCLLVLSVHRNSSKHFPLANIIRTDVQHAPLSTQVLEDSFLTFLAFRWGHREPEPHPPQSLSIHSLAWGPERYSSSVHHQVLLNIILLYV